MSLYDDSDQWIANYGRGRFMRRLRWRLGRTKSLIFTGLIIGLSLGLWLMPILGRWANA